MKLRNLLRRVLSCTAAAVMLAAAVTMPFPEKTAVAAQTATIANPFIWSDVPDDDIIRVGNNYYMVSTTMFFTPGAPIMKSNDLVSWEICNYVYDTYANGDVQNLANGKHDYAHGQWATSLRYHNGYYYVFFGSYGSGKSYIYKTDDIENGTWTRSEINGMYHDASLLFDDDGRNYLVYGGSGEIKIKELNAEMTGFKSGGADKTLFKTGLDGLAGEGAHVHKIGDYYYVFVIAWPNGKRRIELCYRSKELLGYYEGKTVLDSGLGTYGAGVAQGGIVDTPDGKWYGLLFQDHGAVGRIPVLVPVTWQDNWPMMGVDGKAPVTFEVDGGYKGTRLATDDFFNYDSNKLKLEWQWNHNPDNTAWSVTERKGFLRLTNKHTAKSVIHARNTLTMRTEGPACTSYIALDTKGMKPGDHAGLSAFQYKYGNIGVRVEDDGTKKIYMAENGGYGGSDILGSYDKIVEQVNLRGDNILLKAEFKFNNVDANFNVSNNIDKVNFFYSYDGNNWTKIGNELSMSYDLKMFTGYRSAIYSYGTKNTGGYADIDFFCYERDEWNLPVFIEPDEYGHFYRDTFENSADKWTGRGPATVTVSSEQSYEGGKSLFVDGRTSAWNGASKALSTNVFEPGKTYSFSTKVKFVSGGIADTFFMKLQYVDSTGETKYSPIAEGTALKDDWIQLTNTKYTIPEDASNMYIYVETENSTNSFYIDEAIGGVEGTHIAGPDIGVFIVHGDVNCDGKVNIYDVTAARKGIINGITTPLAEANADVDGNGAFEAADLVQIHNYVMGRITEFKPYETESE